MNDLSEEKIKIALKAFLLIDIVEIITQDQFDYFKKALKGLLDQYNNLKEIEEEHRKENGMLHNIINQDQQDLNIYKELLRQEKEKNNKEYDRGYKEGLAKALEILTGGKYE